MENSINLFYLPERDQSFTNDKCFLCGIDLTTENRTDEHIFPKWLQNKFNLWSKQINLLAEGRRIQYKSLTIPCCEQCNGTHLSQLEQYVQMKFEEGYESFKDIDEDKLFYWISKLFYGLLYKELFLPANFREPKGDRILTPELLEQFKTAHMFLQGARVEMEFLERNPWSIFIFNTKTSDNEDYNFDYRDSFQGLTFGIRMGEIGVIAVLQDNGAQAEIFEEEIKKIQKLKLHKIQFEEMFAKVSYKQLTVNRVPSYLTTYHSEGGKVTVMPQLLGSGRIYDEWCEETYSHILSFHTSVQQSVLYVEEFGRTVTYIYDEENNLRDINDGVFS